jgi:hypothetical protein
MACVAILEKSAHGYSVVVVKTSQLEIFSSRSLTLLSSSEFDELRRTGLLCLSIAFHSTLIFRIDVFLPQMVVGYREVYKTPLGCFQYIWPITLLLKGEVKYCAPSTYTSDLLVSIPVYTQHYVRLR